MRVLLYTVVIILAASLGIATATGNLPSFSEVTFLKLLWFVVLFAGSGATWFGLEDTRDYRSLPTNQRFAISSLPLLIGTVFYIFARAITADR